MLDILNNNIETDGYISASAFYGTFVGSGSIASASYSSTSSYISGGLQTIYNNGNEIITTTGFPINLQNGQGSNDTNTIQFKNISGSTTAFIRGDGRATFELLTAVGSSGSNQTITSRQYPDQNYTPGDQTTGNVGQISFSGWDGTGYIASAIGSIRMVAEEYYPSGTYGSSMLFRTTLNGAVSSGTRMILHANGNTGIGTGTTVPTAKLHINNTSTSASLLVEDSTSPDSTPFVIDNTGFVGIGTLTPIRKLNVVDNTIVVAEFEGTNAAGSLIDLETAGTSYNGFRFYNSGSHKMSTTYIPNKDYYQIGTNWGTGGEILIVSSSGNVGIGTTTPTQKLQVSGSILATNLIGTGSQIIGVISSSYALSSSYSISSSFSTTSSFAQTASFVIGPQPYTLTIQALTSSPTASTTRYFGQLPKGIVATADISKVYIPKNGTIKRIYLYCYSGTAGTAEDWSLYIRLNNTTDTLIETVSSATNERIFNNESLNIAVTTSDYFEIKMINPAWVTSPLTTIFGGYIYIE